MRTKYYCHIIPCILICCCFQSSMAQPELKLWYNQPAANWNEALPIGNGKIAAMVFGNANAELLQLNEETIWAGGPHNNIIPGSAETIAELRRLLYEKKYAEAQKLSLEKMRPAQNGMPYLPAGDLLINMKGQGDISEYYRDLNLDSAVSSVSYTSNGVKYKREYFASFNENILVVRMSASKRHSINCDVSLKLPYANSKTGISANRFLFGNSQARGHENLDGKINYSIQVSPQVIGGDLKFSDSTMIITNADAVVLLVSIATNFKDYKTLEGDAVKKAREQLQQVTPPSRSKHTQEYRKYFKRVQLDLGDNRSASTLPTNERLKNFNSSNDPQLVTLYFQFGRYLLISSSRPGNQPATLQGKWNDRINPPWDSKYTININTEMNYWPAEITGLSELSEPLFKMIKELSITGQQSAKEMYGARGWVVHHNTDLWRMTGPVDGGFYGMWPMGGAWFCRHIWEHYLYTGNKVFLQEYYPVLKGAAMFYVDALVKDADRDWLVMSPSMSPENAYTSYRDGERNQSVSLTSGATMDNQIIFELFNSYLHAASALNVDKLFADTVRDKLNLLPPMQVGQYGQLQEWINDWDKPDDKHRHISHLYGLYPAAQITPNQSLQVFEAAKNTLVSRGDVSTGWSMGWKVNFWARMLDGNKAYKLISDQLNPSVQPDGKETGGTYNNLFDAHPPFQIDGNFGCTAGISEMLLQSHDGAIELLPALPDKWIEGKITGLKARGGFTIDMEWKNGKVSKLVVFSSLGGNCRIRLSNTVSNKLLRSAKSNNKNPFYKIDKIKTPVVSEKAILKGVELKEKFEYDMRTTADKTYVLNF